MSEEFEWQMVETDPSCTFSTPEVASPECSTVSEVGPLIPTVLSSPPPPVTLPVTGVGPEAVYLAAVLIVTGAALMIWGWVRKDSRRIR